MIHKHTILYLAGLLFSAFTTHLWAAPGTIVGSKHDLSSPFGGGSDEICVYCHTPHSANSDLDNDGNVDSDHASRPPAPLWNRRITTLAPYQMYTSATLNMACDNTPSPLSLVCLSCHDTADATSPMAGDDGAVNYIDAHNLVNEPNRGDTIPNCGTRCHPGGGDPAPEWFQIGPDLSNEHPISMSYPTPTEDPAFFIPPDLQRGWSDVKLFMGRVECPSCHNPHDPTNIPFLRKSMVASGLCTTCHNI